MRWLICWRMRWLLCMVGGIESGAADVLRRFERKCYGLTPEVARYIRIGLYRLLGIVGGDTRLEERRLAAGATGLRLLLGSPIAWFLRWSFDP
jgi:hypothetical protein